MNLKKGDVIELSNVPELTVDNNTTTTIVGVIVKHTTSGFYNVMIQKKGYDTYSATEDQIKQTGINIFELIKIVPEEDDCVDTRISRLGGDPDNNE